MRHTLARLDELDTARPAGDLADFCESVQDVVMLASSSRGGSSMFAEMLRGTPRMLHFQGEINVFLHQAGLTWPGSGTGSDRLMASHAEGASARLNRPLVLDAGHPSDITDPQAFAHDLAWRLTAQWPGLTVAVARVRQWVDAALPIADETGGLQGFHLRLLASVREAHPQVNPWYYDLSPDGVSEHFPELPVPSGPPSDAIVEEPPFITVQPWRLTTRDSAARPLIIKTPSNAYRLPFWRALFPSARFRVLHLVRNPAASINGLIDGWRFRGFHAHDMAPHGGLSIAGYSDVVPGGRAVVEVRSAAGVGGCEGCAAGERLRVPVVQRPPSDPGRSGGHRHPVDADPL